MTIEIALPNNDSGLGRYKLYELDRMLVTINDKSLSVAD